jgi:hypothetical protein
MIKGVPATRSDITLASEQRDRLVDTRSCGWRRARGTPPGQALGDMLPGGG